jgi:hypothetical protein
MTLARRGAARAAVRPWHVVLALALFPVLPLPLTGSPPGSVRPSWGATGHRIIASVAMAGLPSDMPDFFRAAAAQLEYLNPEPDRWRDDRAVAMNEGFRYDHYVDLENLPPGALDEPDRFTYLRALYGAGLERPERDAGFLPFRILELQQRLTSGFARWRRAQSADERRWIEARIINDAGILGHYVGDASQPHHTTIHFNGWAPGAPNPEDYSTTRDFHSRFETAFVNAHVARPLVASRVPAGTRVLEDVRAEVLAYILANHDQVVPLYELEKRHGFRPGAATPETIDFTADRLADAAVMLRSLWYTAWMESRQW